MEMYSHKKRKKEKRGIAKLFFIDHKRNQLKTSVSGQEGIMLPGFNLHIETTKK